MHSALHVIEVIAAIELIRGAVCWMAAIFSMHRPVNHPFCLPQRMDYGARDFTGTENPAWYDFMPIYSACPPRDHGKPIGLLICTVSFYNCWCLPYLLYGLTDDFRSRWHLGGKDADPLYSHQPQNHWPWSLLSSTGFLAPQPPPPQTRFLWSTVRVPWPVQSSSSH